MEEALAAIVAQNKEIAAQNKDILQQLGSVLPRIENLESKVMKGEPKQFKHSPSSASAETHVMVEEEDEFLAQDRAPKPPVFSRENFGDTPSPLLARSMHQNSDHSFILKDPNIKMTPPKVECKDPSKIKPKEFLEYFENVSASILSWEQVNSTRIHESEEHESDFSEFANFQQQYENENLSQQELEDLWEQFNSHCNHESDDNFSSSGHQEEQEIELEIHSNTDENESLDPGGCQSPFSEASEISAEY